MYEIQNHFDDTSANPICNPINGSPEISHPIAMVSAVPAKPTECLARCPYCFFYFRFVPKLFMKIIQNHFRNNSANPTDIPIDKSPEINQDKSKVSVVPIALQLIVLAICLLFNFNIKLFFENNLIS